MHTVYWRHQKFWSKVQPEKEQAHDEQLQTKLSFADQIDCFKCLFVYFYRLRRSLRREFTHFCFNYL